MSWVPALLAMILATLPVASESQTRSAARNGIDETVSVPKGARLEFDQCRGDVVVRTWNRDAVRVQSSRAGRSVLQVRVRNQVVDLNYSRGPVADQIELTVPAWISLRLAGAECDIDVDGVDGSLTLNSAEGAMALKNLGGTIKAATVDGSITVENCRGSLTLSTVEEDIMVKDATGDVHVETVDGDVILTGIRAEVVEVATIDGDITFVGAWLPRGRYELTTHEGDVWLAVPDNPNATLAVRLFANSDIDATVPLPKAGPSRGRRRVLTFGAGAAQVEVETFDGDVKLRRASEIAAGR